MAHIFKLLSQVKILGEDGDQLKIVGYASTADTDRVGDVIVPDAWTKGGLDNFKKNPIILFNHNYSMPIGKAIELEVDSVGLKITCVISKSAGDTYGLIKDGVLQTFSVGFMIKDADYNQTTDGYIIRDAELLEVSVVTVPCNQAATFSISKSMQNAEELAEFNKEVNALKGQEDDTAVANVTELDTSPKSGTEVPPEIKRMTEEEVQALAQKIANKAIADQKAADQKAAQILADKKAADEDLASKVKVAAEAASKSTEEKLLEAFGEKLKTNEENFQKTFDEFKGVLEEKSKELEALRASKGVFTDRSGGDPFKDPEMMKLADDAFMLSKVVRKGIGETEFGKSVLEKFNTQSSVTVGTDRLETTVGTQIERDIWNELILAPLFREINMNSAQMTFPIMPDAGYAEITSANTASGSQPNGDMDPRGAGFGAPYQGLSLTEKTLTTVKMMAKGYLGNETEEDALIPVLPLIRESMIRMHARGVENLILAGNTNQGVYTSGAANGLLSFAATGGRSITTASSSTKLTSAALFGMRKLMGKYGLDPRNIIYIVSQDAYFQLIEDPEFADADLVGSQANKLTGEVGRLYGSQVIMCDEFAPAAAGNYLALAVNRRNFVIPRLRGVTVESQYLVEEQRTVLVTSQRLGFDEIIPGAMSLVGLKYGA
jgi:HK97 family phage prohead protease/HK97 family phage major capsid protein